MIVEINLKSKLYANPIKQIISNKQSSFHLFRNPFRHVKKNHFAGKFNEVPKRNFVWFLPGNSVLEINYK